MKNHLPQFILVTGAHRSGTTWVGKMLCAGGQAAYISEPLNVHHRLGIMRTSTRYWYTYIQEKNEIDFLQAFQETLSFRYHFGLELRSLRSSKDLLRMLRDSTIFLQGKLRHQIPLIKDPFAVFSIPWFINRLGPQVGQRCRSVLLVRHPLAFVSSLKRLQWPFDFDDLLSQPLLMEDHLEPYRQKMEWVKQNHNMIEGAALLWEIIYSTMKKYQDNSKETSADQGILLVRHEDLSLDPTTQFTLLYHKLGLTYSKRVKHQILKASSSENPVELSRKSVHSVRLDSRANLANWKKRLTTDELNTVRSVTEELAYHFYPDFSWE